MGKPIYILQAFIFLIFASPIKAQKLNLPKSEAIHRYELSQLDTLFRFYAIKPPAGLIYDLNKFYEGYANDSLFVTQGAVIGKLLHGPFAIYYPNGNLKQKGNFKNGLKNGEWKEWDSSGKIIKATYWREGDIIVRKKRPKH